MRWVAVFLVVVGCTAQTQLGPAVTCPDVVLTTSPNGCDLVANQQCSDTFFYEIDCQDDSTCTCVQSGTVTGSMLASSMTYGFCATLDPSQMHDLATRCIDPKSGLPWNINP
jgi:hypothetical protein